jgi:hypothetical protein
MGIAEKGVAQGRGRSSSQAEWRGFEIQVALADEIQIAKMNLRGNGWTMNVVLRVLNKAVQTTIRWSSLI